MFQSVAWDAVVAGGGPAGAAFAIELARNGRRVVLIERGKAASHKVCGEFLSPEMVGLLTHLGVDAGALGATAIHRFRLVTGKRCAEVALPFQAAGLSRYRLDEALLAAAVGSGVELVRGMRVATIDTAGDASAAKSDEGMWRGRAVALATGKHNVRGVERPRGAMVGFKLHLASDAAARLLPGTVQLAFFRGGYFGSCLVEQNTLSVGWVVTPALLREVGADWVAQKAFLARQSDHVAALLEGSTPLFPKPVSTAAIPYGFLRRRPIAPTVFPLGDQLAVVPSFTGDGLAIALCSGIAAARAVLEGKPADVFQREFVGRLRGQFLVAGVLGRLLETPALCGVSVAAAKLLPSLAPKMVLATRLRGFEALTEAR